MAKYIYKNAHFFTTLTMDPKKIIKMSWKVLFAGWGPTACYSIMGRQMHFYYLEWLFLYNQKPIWVSDITKTMLVIYK